MRQFNFAFVLVVLACGGGSSNNGGGGGGGAPAAPDGLTATPANGQVALTWNVVAGATSYKVRRSDAGTAAAQVGTATVASFTDTTPRNGVTYQYTVVASGAGGDSADSAAASAQPFRLLCVSDFSRTKIFVLNAEQPVNSPPVRSFGSQTGFDPLQLAVDLDPVHGELFTANFTASTITVHAAAANGNVAPLRTLTGFIAPNTVAYDPIDDRILVSDFSGVTTFDRTATSTATPARHLTLSSGFASHILLTGAAHRDQLIVADFSNNRLLVYPRTASGTPAPAATITSAALNAGIFGLGYDPVSDEVLVGTGTKVVALPASANGDTQASRTLTIDLPAVTPVAFAVDAGHALLHVVDEAGQVLTFPRGFGANVKLAPSSILSGPLTQLTSENPQTIVYNATLGTIAVGKLGAIVTFDAAATGNTAPLRAISSLGTGITRPGGLAFDKAHNELLVANASGAAGTIAAYGPAASGDTTPLRSLTIGAGASTFATVALDATHNELIVSPGNLQQIPIYARDATGAAAPLRTISGAATQLGTIVGVAYDATGDAIVTGELAIGVNPGLIHRYPRAASGNQSPLTSLGGSNTGFFTVASLIADQPHHELLAAGSSGVVAFDVAATGNIAPARTLSFGFRPAAVVVDPINDELLVSTGSSIQVFPRTAAGTATPSREILHSSTQLSPSQMVICN